MQWKLTCLNLLYWQEIIGFLRSKILHIFTKHEDVDLDPNEMVRFKDILVANSIQVDALLGCWLRKA